jgi:hypothetical protein
MPSAQPTLSGAALRDMLRRLVATIGTAPTIQEGLYRAYMSDLMHLARFNDGSRDFQSEFQAIVAELRTRLGFDNSGNWKIGASTLRSEQARAILSRLEALASRGKHAQGGRMTLGP